MKSGFNIPLVLSETKGIERIDEPVTISVPFSKGELFCSRDVCLIDSKKINKRKKKTAVQIPVQTKPLSRWPDGSIRWLLLDFHANAKANEKRKLNLIKEEKEKAKKNIILCNMDMFVRRIQINAIDDKGEKFAGCFSKAFVKNKGELRSDIEYKGKFRNGKKILFHFIARFSFFSKSSLVKLDLTVINKRAAKHPFGFWDLGDEGSVLFKDLSIKLNANEECDVFYKKQIKSKSKKSDSVFIYQKDASKRMQPTVIIRNKGKKKRFSLSAAVKDFWQNFPKSIEANKNEVIIGLFPKQPDNMHELQGGEKKTHTIYFDFSGGDLDWVQEPLNVSIDPGYVSDTKVIPYLIPLSKTSKSTAKKYQDLIDCAIKGKNSFDQKNERINEYGWRNFGDIYADHEAVHEEGLISHYNNQYDVINGALLQFFRSGDCKWFRIADNLAKHARDIDIYHTKKDKAVYNGGMFWHTFHYMDAGTSTHRSFSRLGAKKMSEFKYGVGGGPSNEHNYATGLMNHYFLTGDISSKEAVISLAEWVINMDDGSKSRLRFLGNRPTGKASLSGGIYYHGPGRGSGNSINVLMDGYEISKNRKYLLKCEELIRRCIHPDDDISDNELEDIEKRWFYLVFLQALGRYLDIKSELLELDYMFYYSKESLMHYARWIFENELPYNEVLHKVDIPSETWPAQDIRKSVVLDYAYKYSGKKEFIEKSNFFFDRCIEDLNTFDTKTFTRPLAILMHYSVMHSHFQKNDSSVLDSGLFCSKRYKFGKPKKFKPQGYFLYKTRDRLKRLTKLFK